MKPSDGAAFRPPRPGGPNGSKRFTKPFLPARCRSREDAEKNTELPADRTCAAARTGKRFRQRTGTRHHLQACPGADSSRRPAGSAGFLCEGLLMLRASKLLRPIDPLYSRFQTLARRWGRTSRLLAASQRAKSFRLTLEQLESRDFPGSVLNLVTGLPALSALAAATGWTLIPGLESDTPFMDELPARQRVVSSSRYVSMAPPSPNAGVGLGDSFWVTPSVRDPHVDPPAVVSTPAAWGTGRAVSDADVLDDLLRLD